MNDQVLFILKCALVFFIAIAPFADFSRLSWIDTIITKVVFLVIIIAICFVDFQVALLVTIAFFILLINVNSYLLKNAKTNSNGTPKQNNKGKNVVKDVPTTSEILVEYKEKQPACHGAAMQTSQYDEIVEQTLVHDNVVCESTRKSDINQHMLNMFIDDKIKPYDSYISMLTCEENLARAQGMM